MGFVSEIAVVGGMGDVRGVTDTTGSESIRLASPTLLRKFTPSRARAKALLCRCWTVGKPAPGVAVNLGDGADGVRGVFRSNTEPINER